MHKKRLISLTRLAIIMMFSMALIPHLTAGGNKDISNPISLSWDRVVRNARNSEVNFYMWGGSSEVNAWIDGIVAKELLKKYQIKLNRVSMNPEVFIDKLLMEKQANHSRGSIDLLWINGENFKNAKEAGLLWGPYVDKLPNFNNFVDQKSVATDFGYPTEGYEAPFGKAWFILEYDTARISIPPANFDELNKWILEHPGRFTYPQPPDFVGSAFLRLALYHLSSGPDKYLEGFDKSRAESGVQSLMAWLKEISPYLWQEGKTYPTNEVEMDSLFLQGEIDFSMNYNVGHASRKIAAGEYPETVRTFVLEGLTLFNHHFTAIPFNSPNKEAALVLSNFLLSPEMQLSKANPENWGDMSVLDIQLLPTDEAAKFLDLDVGPATLSIETLTNNAVPEISPDYVEYIESAWDEFILKQS